MRVTVSVLVACALLASGCEASGDDVTDTGQADAIEPKDETPADTGEDPDVPDAGDHGSEPGPFGFTIRVPASHQVPVHGDGGTTEAWDIDHVCTFIHGTWNGHFYVQASPAQCGSMIGCEYDTVGAWLSLDGGIQQIQDAFYDFGGNHHNDSVEFTFDNSTYKFYHSTIGWGWRKCQPMDCLMVYDATGTSLVEDGCTPDRTIPIVCVEVAQNGSVPEFPTTFEKCPGDPN